MGMFDNLEGKALNSVMGGSSNPLGQQLLQMINNHPGGLAGLIQTFHQKGLGDVVNSWVSTGQNQPISPDQVHSAFGQRHGSAACLQRRHVYRDRQFFTLSIAADARR